MGEKIVEAIVDFANAIEAACVQLRRYIGEVHGVGVSEDIFLNLLSWEKGQGSRIGEFEFTTRKANNSSNAFNHAYNVLKANNASIGNRFHDEGFQYSYWLFSSKPDTVYRQVLKKKT